MAEVPDIERCDHSKLRWIMTGGEPVPVALLKRYADLGVRARQGYGLTEACGPACLMDSENALARPDSAGKPYFHTSFSSSVVPQTETTSAFSDQPYTQ